MDSTHGTCVDDTSSSPNGKIKRCYLYTLVARCSATGKGAPLAWMITNTETQYPIQYWLQWLHEDHGFSPQQFMIDNSDAEIAGIRSVFGGSVRILLCHWHIIKNWKKNIAMKLKVQPGVRRSRVEITGRRDLALVNMLKLLNARNEGDYDVVYMEFQQWCQSDQETWDSGDLLVYFDREYVNKKDLWSSAWRRVSILKSGVSGLGACVY
jgi:hypothetical protein